MLNNQNIIALSGSGNHHLADTTLASLNEFLGTGRKRIGLTHIDYSIFADDEPDFFIVRERQDQIAGSHVLVFQSGDDLEYFEEFKDLIFDAKAKGAKFVTAVYFFMYGRRQDHGEHFPHKINRNLRYIKEIKLAGADNLVLVDIHSQETISNCKKVGLNVVNIDTSPVFADYIVEYANHIGQENFLVYSPDFGSAYRALSLAKILGVKVVITPKVRHESGKIETVKPNNFQNLLKKTFPGYSHLFVPFTKARIKGKWIAMREDELGTGGTAFMTGRQLRDMGAARLYFCATHPVCVKGWKRKMGLTNGTNPFDRIYLGNTIHREYRNRTGGIVTDVNMSYIIAGKLFSLLLNSQ